MGKNTLRKMFYYGAAIVLYAVQMANTQALTVTLMWDANPAPDVAGYRLHYGTASQTYTQDIDVGNSTTATVSNLPAGTYFFAATAYNTIGIESTPSNEVAYAPTPTPNPTSTPNPSSTPTPTATSAPTSTPTPSLTPSPTPIPTATPGQTSTPTPTPNPTATPLITVSPTTINFTGVAGGAFPAPQSIQVTTSNGGTWTSFDTSPWFNTSPTNTGASGAFCVLTPHTEGLVAGTYSQNITFSAVGLPNRVVVVNLTLTASPTPTPAATPASSSTPTPTPNPTPTATPPTNCVPGTFLLRGNSSRSGTPGNIRTFTVNGVTAKVSGFSRKQSNGVWTTSWLSVSSQGLGITGRSEGNGNNHQHAVDNIGDSTDYMLFEFSTPIVVTQAFLDYIYAGRSNLSAWIGTEPNPIANHLTLSDTLLGSLGIREDNNSTNTASSRWAVINAAQNVGNVLVIAASVSDPVQDDGFKIHKLQFCQAGAPAVTPTPPPANPAGLTNVSTRLFVQSGDNVMIGGFIIAGDAPKDIILRAIGPSLATFGVSGAMAHPALRVFDSTGAVIASNDSWRSDQSEVIEDTGLAPTDDFDAAIVTTLPPGAYTAVVEDGGNNPGVALFEFYDLDSASSQLVNLSTRGKVENEDSVMIGGFVIGGDQPTKVILRAIGPSLTQLGIQDALVDPTLELHNGDGSLIAQNDNWRSNQEPQILDSALPPSDDRESAIVATLLPGPYTAIVRGTGNSTGVALFEIYRLTP